MKTNIPTVYFRINLRKSLRNFFNWQTKFSTLTLRLLKRAEIYAILCMAIFALLWKNKSYLRFWKKKSRRFSNTPVKPLQNVLLGIQFIGSCQMLWFPITRTSFIFDKDCDPVEHFWSELHFGEVVRSLANIDLSLKPK